MLPISKEILVLELTQARTIIDKWLVALDKGIPLVDYDALEAEFQQFVVEFCGEIELTGDKCKGLSEIFMSRMG